MIELVIFSVIFLSCVFQAVASQLAKCFRAKREQKQQPTGRADIILKARQLDAAYVDAVKRMRQEFMSAPSVAA